MKKSIKLCNLIALPVFTIILFSGCQKISVKDETTAKEKASDAETLVSSNKISPTGTALKQEIASAFDLSQTIEIKIWADYVDGNHPHAEVSVDPDFTLIGGGAQVTNFSNNNSGINALLTAAYPKDDGTFSTFVADSKDHLSYYNHRLWVYAIGMKLYKFGSVGFPMPSQDLKLYMNLTKVTSNYTNHPIAVSTIPTGNVMLSGGAKVNWSAPGNLLTESGYNIYGNGSTQWRVSSKDHLQGSNATIESYVLSVNPNLPDFVGTIQTTGGASSVKTNGGDQGENGMSTTIFSPNLPGGDEPWLLSGVGAFSTYNGVGRMLTAIYPSSTTTAVMRDKDHLQADGGRLYGTINGIRKGY